MHVLDSLPLVEKSVNIFGHYSGSWQSNIVKFYLRVLTWLRNAWGYFFPHHSKIFVWHIWSNRFWIWSSVPLGTGPIDFQKAIKSNTSTLSVNFLEAFSILLSLLKLCTWKRNSAVVFTFVWQAYFPCKILIFVKLKHELNIVLYSFHKCSWTTENALIEVCILKLHPFWN